MAPFLLGPGQGETITERAERTVLALCDHELVDVTWSRYEPGERGPDAHVHERHADAFYVLSGELAFGLGPDAKQVRAPAGTLVLVPERVIHSFGNDRPETATFLNVHAPGMGFVESLRARQDGRDDDAARFDSLDPPADGGRSVADVVVRGPGEGERIAAEASSALFKAEGGDGEGTFSLTEVTLAVGFPGPVPHLHKHLVDTFFVLDGTLTLRLGDDEAEAGPGSYAVVPPGNVHAFANHGDGEARVLNLMAPGGFEQYLRELARATAPGGPPDPRLMAEIASKYDFTPV